MRLRARLFVGLLIASISLAATPAAAISPPPPTLIDFEQDLPGGVPNGFDSVDSSFVDFWDTNGAQLAVGAFGAANQGLQGLRVGTRTDDSALEIHIDRPTFSLSLVFGNDTPATTDPGDEAVLRLYRNSKQVAERRVTLNRNGVADQRIGYNGGRLFNRAVFKFDVDPTVGAVEIVDNIRVGPLCTILGTPGADQIVGTNSNDVICSLGGDDTIDSGLGADIIYAGGGDDDVNSGWGADVVLGEDGNDLLSGFFGTDKLLGGPGRDDLDGGDQFDRCGGGPAVDTATNCEVTAGIP